jgi:S-adenosylmethionine/arginine decarboxylase-like enzyme
MANLRHLQAGDILGFGSHVVIDGFGAEVDRLSRDALCDVVMAVSQQLEGQRKVHVEVLEQSGFMAGISAGTRLDESHVIVHAFPDCAALSLIVFSRKYLDWHTLAGELKTRFDIGRYDSHIANRSRMLPKHNSERALHSHRQYTAFRLECNGNAS